MEEKIFNDKVKKVLKKFLQPDFKVKNDVYLNLLLTHLTEKSLTDNADLSNSSIVNVPSEILTEWIIEATKLWCEGKIVPPPFILSFLLNLSANLSRDERIFIKLNSENIYENLIKVVQLSHDGQAIVKLGFTNLLHSFLGHKSGLHWIIATPYWIEIVNLNMQAQTIYVKKQGYTFVAGLLEKTISFNEMFCKAVVNVLVKPIKNFILLLPGDGKAAPQVDNKSAYSSLRPSLCFLCHILEGLITSIPSNIKIFKIFVDADTWTCITKILLISHEQEFSFILLKMMALALIFSAYEFFKDDEANLTAKDFFSHSLVLQYFDLMTGEIEKGHFCNVIQLGYQNHIYWRNASLKTPLCFRKGVAIELENQVMVILLLPILVYSFSMAGESVLTNRMIEDEFRRDYVVKLLKKSGVKTLQLGYLFKARLSTLPDITEYSLCALRYLIQSRKFYTQESGALVFQPLVYCLQDCLSSLSEGHHNQLTPQTYTFLDTLLEAIIVYIETFKLTWKDSIVTICVMNLAYTFLTISETLWDTKLVVQGLKLLNATISYYMSPNMALLMDTTKESVLSLVGGLLYAKCHNSRWEIRDSALEVIYTLSFNANNRYPTFQTNLLESDIPQLVLQMGLTDGEPFVRSTAIRCLQVAVLVPSIWERLLEYASDFYEKILTILQTEPEGVVRKEAATLMTKIFDEHDIPQKLLSKVYDIMTHAAVADLHWEVKVNAIAFWDIVIKKHLFYQGMIDGTFPSFTFSIENRKIVNLNGTEVKKRLVQVLYQLSDVGCLAVFVNAIQDDCDLEVSKTATDVIKGFIDLLQKYEVTISSVENSQPPSSSMSPSSFTSVVSGVSDIEFDTGSVTDMDHIYIHSPDFSVLLSPPSVLEDYRSPADPVPASSVSDQMLDDFLNASDVTLLQRIFNPSDQVMSNSVSIKGKSVLPPRDFLKFMLAGVESHSKEKSNWLSSLNEFGSLLDDILREYDDKSETNDMDCY